MVFKPKWNEGWLLSYLEHEITSSIHAILSLLDLPFVLGGAVVWTASFLLILSIGILLLWLVQVIFFFVVYIHLHSIISFSYHSLWSAKL